jgi:hypothetical protein
MSEPQSQHGIFRKLLMEVRASKPASKAGYNYARSFLSGRHEIERRIGYNTRGASLSYGRKCRIPDFANHTQSLSNMSEKIIEIAECEIPWREAYVTIAQETTLRTVEVFMGRDTLLFALLSKRILYSTSTLCHLLPWMICISDCYN